MFFQHVYDKCLAQASYVVGCQATGEAIVIDAKRDITDYLKIAKENNLKITHIAETHIHADFLCGSRELAAVTGAKMYLSEEGGEDWLYDFDHIGLKHNDKITVGNLTLEVLHTPGHTPEHISFLLTDHPATDAPIMIFTGDFVFVGDIGRPDLLEKAAGYVGTQEKGARQMFESIKRFKELEGFLQLWPGHGSGSACGKSLGAVPSSTVGYELIRNWAMQYGDHQEEEFVNELLDGQPEPPKYFAQMKRLNKINRPLVLELPNHKTLTTEEFLEIYKRGAPIFDTRHKNDVANGYLPGAIHINGDKSFVNWIGWLGSYDVPQYFIVDPENKENITRQLLSIGLDNIGGFITDVNTLDIPLKKVNNIGLDIFREYVRKENVQLVDVRNLKEYNDGHVPGSDHVFLGTLEENLDKISKNKEVVIYCQSGNRSSVAYSILSKNGFENIINYTGGMKEWKEQKEEIAQ